MLDQCIQEFTSSEVVDMMYTGVFDNVISPSSYEITGEEKKGLLVIPTKFLLLWFLYEK